MQEVNTVTLYLFPVKGIGLYSAEPCCAKKAPQQITYETPRVPQHWSQPSETGSLLCCIESVWNLHYMRLEVVFDRQAGKEGKALKAGNAGKKEGRHTTPQWSQSVLNFNTRSR